MSSEYEEFKKTLIRARVTKFIDRYLKQLETEKRLEQDQKKEHGDFLPSNESDKVEIEEESKRDEILVGRWIQPDATADDVSKFRKEIAPELLPIMNALVRSAIEKYAKRKKFRKVDGLCKKHTHLVDQFKMKYDENEQEMDVLNINRHLRNEYLHGDKRKDFPTSKTNKEILLQRITITRRPFEDEDEYENKGPYIKFFSNQKVKVCDLLDEEKQILANIKMEPFRPYYAEFLAWRVKNLIQMIDRSN